MGSFYVNYTVRCGDQAAVAKSLKGRSAYVTPVKGGALVVTETQVLAVPNHDDDMLWYGLFDKGRLTDEYNSSPDYFAGGDSPPVGGNARTLCAAFARAGSEKAIESVLKKQAYVVAMERHADK